MVLWDGRYKFMKKGKGYKVDLWMACGKALRWNRTNFYIMCTLMKEMVTKYSFGTHDIWCEDHSLKVLFLDFYACPIVRDASVYSVLISQIDGACGVGMSDFVDFND